MEYRAENGTVITDEMLDKMAKEYENGTWSGHGKVTQGRPRIYDEDMETVSFRIPKSRIVAIEAVAKTGYKIFQNGCFSDAFMNYPYA